MAYIAPNSQSYNFTHMFNMTDNRGPLPKKVPCPGSLWDIICSSPRFTKFRFLVEKAMMSEILNSPQADFTVFVPLDENLTYFQPLFEAMDTLSAKRIVNNSLVQRRLSSEVLMDSPKSYLYTMQINPDERLCITNMCNRTFINGEIDVVNWDIMATNGIIHTVNSLLVPYII